MIELTGGSILIDWPNHASLVPGAKSLVSEEIVGDTLLY